MEVVEEEVVVVKEKEENGGLVGGGGFQICWFALGKVDLVVFEGSHQFRCEIFILGVGGTMIALVSVGV